MTTADTHAPSRGCYQRGCKSPACAQANYRYTSRLRLDHHRGQKRRRSAAQSRTHIERLITAGWTQAQIARAAGLAHHVIGDVRRGQAYVANATALAILSVHIGPPPADVRNVDATGTTRRLRALVAIGWPIGQLAPVFGMYATALGNIARGELQQVRTTTADLVALHYQHLTRAPGPSNRTRILARKKGWHGPAAWEDIDDPNCEPEETGAFTSVGKFRRDNDRNNEIEHLYLLNESVPSIAAQVGSSEKYVRDQLTEILRKRAERAEAERLAARRAAKQRIAQQQLAA
ncbi:hypothetical protein OOK06_36790 [Streptomyces sp. NBC_00340]|uniref:hypothetical protein n=1 Tax=Streptomyces sp. NBC_00340 TaxID=2975716 RepID=UPI002250A4F5|nr:hypothetical protein [Streptomyces sp. NBC_00340]MCX5137629.1 hypothetical protein [Streptomyces sp. NBC_00340]